MGARKGSWEKMTNEIKIIFNGKITVCLHSNESDLGGGMKQ